MKKYTIIVMLLVIIPAIITQAYEPQKRRKAPTVTQKISTNVAGVGLSMDLTFTSGPEFNHPLMAVWLETVDGEYIQSLYVAESMAKGFFSYGDKSSGKWQPGVVRRPAALPYWSYQRGVQEADGLYIPTTSTPLPDAYSGATPNGDFILNTRSDAPVNEKFRVLFEINQSWDWNEYWTNNKYPNDTEYMTSSQPSVVYAVTIDPNSDITEYYMNPIGHGHYAGANGVLYTDLSTVTTALWIAESIKIEIVK